MNYSSVLHITPLCSLLHILLKEGECRTSAILKYFCPLWSLCKMLLLCSLLLVGKALNDMKHIWDFVQWMRISEKLLLSFQLWLFFSQFGQNAILFVPFTPLSIREVTMIKKMYLWGITPCLSFFISLLNDMCPHCKRFNEALWRNNKKKLFDKENISLKHWHHVYQFLWFVFPGNYE